MLAALLTIVLGLAYGPLLLEFAGNLWARPYYQHFPFVLVAAGLLIGRALRTTPTSSSPPSRLWVWLGVAAGWGLLVYSYYLHSPWLAAVSFLLTAGGLLAAYCRASGRGMPIGAWLLLFLVIPPPANLDRNLLTYLQRLSSTQASHALDLLGVNHLMQGNALLVADKQLFVDEACSGIVSVVSIVTCAALYGVLRSRSLLHVLLLAMGGVLWATLLNVIRITLIASVEVWFGWDWTVDPSHTLLGLAVFTVALLLLVATDWLLRFLLGDIEWEGAPESEAVEGLGLVPLGWNALVAWPHLARDPDEGSPGPTPAVGYAGLQRRAFTAAGLLLAVAPLQLLLGAPDSGNDRVLPPFDLEPALAALVADGVLPPQLSGLELQSVEHISRPRLDLFGQNSVVFLYRSDKGDRYLVSCDFPYNEAWHELAICYQGIGWELDRRTTGDDEQTGLHYASLELTQPGNEAAYAVFTAWGEDGEWVEPRRRGLTSRLWRDPDAQTESSKKQQHYFQAQVLCQSSTGLPKDAAETARQLLVEAAPRFMAVLGHSR
ncbi:Transmembrane exosortase [Posidoniimonas polymericola]|uniref:Transmembrane exosortase n=1 Tax=Posidoniimonas polymericola TaxID=2528002 RepID=A0A5C5YTT5_9BACT|nr:exosortase U [Posidoniimonas polymericola]TWT78395.1 Transmembrane exosortase [Posidoniimonas polymericola]